MSDQIPTGFFAYPSSPSTIPEVISTAVRGLNDTALVSIKTWEQCRVGGNVIIQELCKEIGKTDLFCADMTGMNANVMFELGYAIARNKRTWLILDTSFSESRISFDQLRILTTVGYASYCNSQEIKAKFLGQNPCFDLKNTIFENAIRPSLVPTSKATLLYLRSRHDIEASVRLTKRLELVPTHLITDDPHESGAQSLSWYGRQLYSAQGVVCHLTSPEREGARLHNARYALVAGMAFGMDKPLLMLEEGDFLAPVDYRDLLRHYRTAAQAAKFLEEWLDQHEEGWSEAQPYQEEYAQTIRLATELKGLQLGEYVAENEADRLVSEYFVETSAYREALEGTHTVFVGRKGSGKTANLLKLASELARDRHNLVVVVKPVAYELHGIVELMRKYKERDLKGYALESLWKFILYTEIANAAVQSIEQRPDSHMTGEERELVRLVEGSALRLTEDFSIRLERCVEGLLAVQHSPNRASNIESSRLAISEALHSGVLGELRIALGNALKDKKRVAILIDNLDKAWGRHAQLPELTQFLLGLLTSAGRVRMDFKRSDSRRESINVSLAIFLRSDIFHEVMGMAREPDKIRYSRLSWNDPQLLVRIIEERFIASHEGNVQPAEMWTRYFCPKVRGVDTKEYFLSRILKRPRDLVLFVKAAISTAVNRGHVRVDESDVIEGEKQYSQYALDSILVENEITTATLEAVLYEFVGRGPYHMESEVYRVLSQAGVSENDRDGVLDHLCALTFLGVEANQDDFRFAIDRPEYRKNLVLARRLAQTRAGGLRFMINPAFWAFLEIRQD